MSGLARAGRVRGLARAVAAAAALTVAACGSSGGPQPGQVEVVQTTATLSERLTHLRDLSFTTASVHGIPVIHVDDSVGYQRIGGFGAAMTDTSAWLLYMKLAPATRATVMRNLFGNTGIHLSVLRVPIGASDFTATGVPYTYDDLPPGQTDPSLARFSIAHDDAYILPALREARAANPGLELLAAPWSAPAWMKANGSLDDPHKQGTLLPDAYGPFARYFVKFLQAYAGAGAPIDAITPQNEPEFGSSYPSMTLSEPDEARFITRYLSPALSGAGLSTKIYGFDFNWYLHDYPESLSSDPAVRSDISGIAWHCYVGNPTAMTAQHQADPGLDQLETECSSGISPGPPAELEIASIRNWSTTVLLWNLALDPSGGPVQPPNSGCSGCTGVVTVDPQAHSVAYTLDYYQLGQLSSFVQLGASRISSDHFVQYRFGAENVGGGYATAGLDDVAFENPDGSKVVLAYDNSARPVRFAVAWHGRSFSYTLPARATVTFIWR